MFFPLRVYGLGVFQIFEAYFQNSVTVCYRNVLQFGKVRVVFGSSIEINSGV